MSSKKAQKQVLSHFDHPTKVHGVTCKVQKTPQRTRPEKLYDLVVTISHLLAPFCRKFRIGERKKKKKKKFFFWDFE